MNTASKTFLINQQNLNQYDYQSSFNEFSNYFINNYKSVISDTFYGMYNSMVTCFNCNSTTYAFSDFNLLIFPLNEVRLFKDRNQDSVINIYDCFEYYQKSELMSGDNQYIGINVNQCLILFVWIN